MEPGAVRMNWDDYEIYHPGVFGPLNTLPRADARRAFNALMAAKPGRIEMLRRLLRADGIELRARMPPSRTSTTGSGPASRADPGQPGRPLPEWYSVVNDVALFLGDVMIERCPGLRWEFSTWGKKNVSYQRHVIMGFSQVPNPKYNIDIDRAIAAYGHRIVARRGSVPHYGRVTVGGVEIDVDAVAARRGRVEVEDDAFLQWVKAAQSQA